MGRRVVVWWIKRDARVEDNSALTEAAHMDALVLPVFCFEPSVMSAADASPMHTHAQWQAICHLRERLRAYEVDVLVTRGEVVDQLARLREQLRFTHLFSHEEIGTDITFQRDRAAAAWCRGNDVVYREFPQSSVRRTGVNRDFLHALWKARIEKSPPHPVPKMMQSPEIRRIAARTRMPRFHFPAVAPTWQPVTEFDAEKTLNDFLNRRGVRYRGGISSPNTAETAGSRLSVHLAWGTITARQVWHATRTRIAQFPKDDPDRIRWRSSLESFLSRLHWRDHFTQRLESEPELEFRSIHPAYREIPYSNDSHRFAAWREGHTGFPMVDAVMRCLAATGFINFRMRAMAVSFACHALHLDWRLINGYLAGVFRDYDPGIHLSQLQMQAGVVGWNTIRVYNPTKQLKDWDIKCKFVKRWLPELKDERAERIFRAHEQPIPGYAPAIVDFVASTRMMKDILYRIRATPEAKAATPAIYAKHGSRTNEARFRNRGRRQQTKKSASAFIQRTMFDEL